MPGCAPIRSLKQSDKFKMITRSEVLASSFEPESGLRAMLTSSVDVERYAADGFVIVRGLFSPAEIAEASAEADRLFARRDLIDSKNLRCRWQNHYQSGECRFDAFDPVIDLSPMTDQLAHDTRRSSPLSAIYTARMRFFSKISSSSSRREQPDTACIRITSRGRAFPRVM